MNKKQMISAEELDHIENDLISRREELWQQIRDNIEKRGIEEHQQLMQNIRDKGDTALAELRESNVYTYVQQKTKEIEQIDESLRKLRLGEYGICEDCGETISIRRLKVLPHALRCRDCQEQRDRIHGN